MRPIKIFPNFSALKKAVKGGMIFENGEIINVGKCEFNVQLSTNDSVKYYCMGDTEM